MSGLDIAILGLSITSSWGNGHATTYRSLLRALAERGHRITFYERDTPWYRPHRDLEDPPYCRVALYRNLSDIPREHAAAIVGADLVVLGSYVPDGAILADWLTTHARGVTAFYDIDTPVTLARLEAGKPDYISAPMIPRFDLYLSFTGGPVLDLIEERYGSPRPRPLYCAVDPDCHAPVAAESRWTLGYLGTYSADRQPTLQQLLLDAAGQSPEDRFVVAGAQYPDTLQWPDNVDRFEHVAPAGHSAFYSSQRFTLNVTRADMKATGYSPSVRLFEAAACGVPIITDRWPGLETFFTPNQHILTAETTADVLDIVRELPEERRRSIAAAARRLVMERHTAAHRARELETYYEDALRHRQRRSIGAVA